MQQSRNISTPEHDDALFARMNRRLPIALLLCFALFIGMRSLFITADPPQDLSISGALYSDEGFKTLAARNQVLFGDYKWTPIDEYDNWGKKSPAATEVFAFMFRRFGTGFASIRAVSVIYSILTILALYLFMLRNFGRNEALAGCILYGISFFTVMMNRTGLYETHMNFYLAASLLCFSESRLQLKRPGGRFFSRLAAGAAFAAVGAVSIIFCYHIKGSLMIIAASIAPAAVLLFFAGNGGGKRAFGIFFFMLAAIVTAYLVIGHLPFIREKTLAILSGIRIFGIPLKKSIPVGFLAPIQEMAGLSLYLEFIFLQPVTAFLALFGSAAVFYRFTLDRGNDSVRLVLASWLFFGFMLLVMLKYHPSRYFHLLTIPMAAIAADALVNYTALVRDCSRMSESRAFRIIQKTLTVLAVLYVPVVVFVQIVPFSARNRMVRFVYDSILKKTYGDALQLVIPAVLIIIPIIALTVFRLDKIKSALASPGAKRALVAIIIALHVFQYGRWAIFHESVMYDMSKKIGAEFPENAVIAGSWSANLCIENNLRPLVIQKNAYNHAPLNRIIANRPIPVNRIVNGKTRASREKDIPLYLTLSPNVVFEQDTVRMYAKYLKPEKLIMKEQAGYFDILVYRIR
ncbi:MAG TPA: glycosyltransferase family 39 protein [Spirochaetota bacterium]|nr:glycosyltransferase family 39 protein [Spirochaetota bacterium]